jgi:hypothetical protein
VVCTVDDDRFLHRVFEVVSDAITKHGPQVGGSPPAERKKKCKRNCSQQSVAAR